jgi:hypothetical protein
MGWPAGSIRVTDGTNAAREKAAFVAAAFSAMITGWSAHCTTRAMSTPMTRGDAYGYGV